MASSQEQAQEQRPGKNMLWGGRFTGSSACVSIYLAVLRAVGFWGIVSFFKSMRGQVLMR